MSSKTSKNSCSGITRLYHKWGHSFFLLTLACIVWFLWRVGTKPTRISYPCQRIALTQIVLFFSSTTIALPGICYQFIRHIRERQYVKLAGILLLIVLLIGSSNFYQNYRENQLRIAGSSTIPTSSSVASRLVNRIESRAGAQSNVFPATIGMDDPVVSFNHDPSMSYGGTTPYDPEDNPAYNFVWQTVETLGLGSSYNPLDDLINAGDTVLIKPNWVDFGPAVYTRPEVVRPLIDMAIAAGATTIYIGDGGGNFAVTDDVVDNAGYSQMVSQLASRHPGITIQTVNLISLSYGWHWISLGSNSNFASSNYTHYDLGAAGATLYNHQHYRTADPQGVNPNGDTLGWYAVSDRILGADVIINVPKMKTHQIMIATLSIKNLVGCAQGCTYDEQADDCQPRIAHHKTSGQDYYFGNDIFWRAILDMNKIILYSDQNGILQPTQQRKYLTVIDGIQAMEKSQHHQYGGGGIPYDRHVILASVDPVAADAVGCRIMGYDYSVIPSIANADSDTVHPIGTNDPENMVVVGSEIDSTFNHVFQFNSDWAGDAGALAITDFTPPTINAISRQDDTVTANVSGGLVAYILYQVDGENHIERMTKDGDIYSITVPGTVSGYRILAQDEHFNTAQVSSYVLPTVVTNDATNLGPYSARLNGTLTDLGTASSANVSFMWGTSSGNLTSETTIQSTNATGSYYFDLGGLSANTTYYYQAKAVGHGTAYGNELSFTTVSVAAPPSFLFKWGSAGYGDGQFSAPDGIAIDSSGNVYVADTGNHRIQKFTSSGQFITKWGSLGNSDGQFYSPHGVAVDSSGNVYVVDTSNHRIQKFTSSGQFITKWGSFGDADGQFNNPYDLAVDSSGNVYVADTYSHRVQKFTENGAFLAKWGSAGYGDGQLNYPQGIAVDSSGSVYVSDYATSHRVQKFSDNGTFLIKWGSEGSGDGQFFDPRGLAVDRSDNVYVVDWGNGRIQKFSDNGTFLSKWGQFNGPYGVAVNSIGNVYVVENGNNQIQVFGTPTPPSVTTDNASNLGYYWARLNGNLTDLGTATSAQVSFAWGLSSGNYTAATSEQTMNTAGAFHFDLSALSANTTYYYRAKAVGHGTVFGDERAFTTSPSDFPGVATDNATDRTTNSAVLNGTLFSRGTASSANVSFEWGTSSGNYPAETFPQSMNSSGSFSANLTGLSPGTTYYYRAKAVGNGIGYGEEKSFATLATTPAVTTDNATSITSASAVLNGTLTDLGTSSQVVRYFQWGLSTDYPNEILLPGTTNVTGAFYAPLYGLAANTTYYFRAKVLGLAGGGFIYGEDRSFTTLPVPVAPPFLFQWGFDGSGDGQFHSPYSITIDSTDHVYVSDGNGRIQRFDAAGNFILKWGSVGTGDGQFYGVRGIAIDQADNIYVVDSGNGRIQKFSDNGTFLTKWGTPGIFDGELNWPEGIAVDSLGNVYVADTDNNRVQKFSDNGTFLAKWGGLDTGNGNGQFNHPQDVVVDASGNVYVADYDNWRIQKFTSSGEFITSWDANLPDPVYMNRPTGLGFDNTSNTLYVANFWNDRVNAFDPVGGFRTKWGITGSATGQFFHPNDVAVSSLGNIYVVDQENNRIQVFGNTPLAPPSVRTEETTSFVPDTALLSGTLINMVAGASANVSFEWGLSSANLTQHTPPVSMATGGSFSAELTGLSAYTVYYFRAKMVAGNVTAYGDVRILPPALLVKFGRAGTGDGEFLGPRGIAIDTAGSIYVVDASNNRVQKFTSSGQFVTKWGSLGSGDGQLHYPQGIAVDSNGNVYVADNNNHRIQKFTSSGQFVTKWGSLGTGDGHFTSPNGVAVDSSGNVYVVEWNSSRVQKFTGSGSFITKWVVPFIPSGIALDPLGNIYLVDWYNSRVQKFSDNGTLLASWGTPGSGDGQFQFQPYPELVGVAVDAYGNVYVADGNNMNRGRIQKFSDSGTFITRWGQGGSGDGQFRVPQGLAVDTSGNVYVADTGNSRVQVFACAGTVVTNDATSISPSSAVLNGTLNSLSGQSSASVSFEWGLNSGNLTYETAVVLINSTGIFSANLTGLLPNRTYYFRAKALGNGTSYGTEESFTTLTPVPPSVTTDNATGVGPFSARLNGTLTDLGTASSANVSFMWGTSSGNLTSETPVQTVMANVTFYYDLGSLSDNTTYYFCAKAVGHGTNYGTEESFTTLTPVAPSVTTDSATNVSSFSAWLNGTLTDPGTASSANVSFMWGTSSGNLTSETPIQMVIANVTFYYDLGSLSPSTVYYFRAKAVGHGTSNGIEKSFTTSAAAGGGGGGGGGGGAPPTPGFTSIIPYIDFDGVFIVAASIKSEDGNVQLTIDKGTVAKDKGGWRLIQIGILKMTEQPPAPTDAKIVSLVYDIQPEEATFSPAITLTMKFDPQALPAGSKAAELYIALWDGNAWKGLTSKVDTQANTVSTLVDHFSRFAVISKLPAPSLPPAPASFTVSDLTVAPTTCEPGEEVTISARVTNTGGSSGGYDVVLSVNGVQESTKYVALDPGDSLTVSFALKKTVPETYRVDLNGLAASFVVEKPVEAVSPTTAPALTPTPASQAAPQQFNWLITLGIVIGGVIVLGGVIYGVMWRRRRGQAAKPG